MGPGPAVGVGEPGDAVAPQPRLEAHEELRAQRRRPRIGRTDRGARPARAVAAPVRRRVRHHVASVHAQPRPRDRRRSAPRCSRSAWPGRAPTPTTRSSSLPRHRDSSSSRCRSRICPRCTPPSTAAESLIAMLAGRAGEPSWGPEILIRHQLVGIIDALPDFYASWEQWAAEFSESHSSYPVLLLFRSPDPWSSWVLALLSVLDAAAMQLALNPTTTPSQARLCLRMGYTALRRVSRVARVGLRRRPAPRRPASAFARRVRDSRRPAPRQRIPHRARRRRGLAATSAVGASTTRIWRTGGPIESSRRPRPGRAPARACTNKTSGPSDHHTVRRMTSLPTNAPTSTSNRAAFDDQAMLPSWRRSDSVRPPQIPKGSLTRSA